MGRKYYGLVILLFFCAVLLVTYAAVRLSPTHDEKELYVKAGIYLWQNRKWDQFYTYAHPPLTFFISGLFNSLNLTSENTMLIRARLSLLPVFIALGLLIYIVASRRSMIAGIFALFLFAFNPDILAHAVLATPDMLFTLFVFAAICSLYKYIIHNQNKYLILTALTAGMMLLTKHHGAWVIIFLLLFYAYARITMPGNRRWYIELSVLLVLIYIVIRAGFLFTSTWNESAHILGSNSLNVITKLPLGKTLLSTLPLPFVKGLDYQLMSSNDHLWRAFIAGEFYEGSRWYFFPLSFLIKTPMPVLIFIIVFSLTVACTRYKLTMFDKFLLIFCLWFILGIVLLNKRNLGLRYLLPIYPLIFVILSRIVTFQFWRNKDRLFKLVMTGLCLWYFIGSVKIAPHYLAFANEIIGGPEQAWKYFADSNLDWGQGTYLIEEYIRKHPEVIVNPRLPKSGKIAVSVNEYNLFQYSDYEWLRKLNKEPIQKLGYVWLIFEVNDYEIRNR